MTTDNKVIPFRKKTKQRKKMTLAESKKYAKKVDAYIVRIAPLVQKQLEHLIDVGLKLHEPDYTPFSVKGRIDSQSRGEGTTLRDYFLDGKIFLSVELPTMEFNQKDESVIAMSFRMFNLKGEPVDDNDVSTRRAFDPLFDYSFIIDVITQVTKKYDDRYGLAPKDFIWCSSVDWHTIEHTLLSMSNLDLRYYVKHFGIGSTMYMHNIGKKEVKVDNLMMKIFYDDLFFCFFKEVQDVH